jgi:hypothetical protein
VRAAWASARVASAWATAVWAATRRFWVRSTWARRPASTGLVVPTPSQGPFGVIPAVGSSGSSSVGRSPSGGRGTSGSIGGTVTPSGRVVVVLPGTVLVVLDPSGDVVDVVGSAVVVVVLEVPVPSGTVLDVEPVVGGWAPVAGPNAMPAATHTTSAAAAPSRFTGTASTRWRWSAPTPRCTPRRSPHDDQDHGAGLGRRWEQR